MGNEEEVKAKHIWKRFHAGGLMITLVR